MSDTEQDAPITIEPAPHALTGKSCSVRRGGHCEPMTRVPRQHRPEFQHQHLLQQLSGALGAPMLFNCFVHLKQSMNRTREVHSTETSSRAGLRSVGKPLLTCFHRWGQSHSCCQAPLGRSESRSDLWTVRTRVVPSRSAKDSFWRPRKALQAGDKSSWLRPERMGGCNLVTTRGGALQQIVYLLAEVQKPGTNQGQGDCTVRS